MSEPLIASIARYEVIVLEGCDGTGKSTLAAALADRYGYDSVHCGRTPDGTNLPGRYQAILTVAGKLVLDRSFISELVYGPLDHGRSRLTAQDAVALARQVAGRDGVLVHLTGQPQAITARLRARGGPDPDPSRVDAIVRAYYQAFALLGGAAPVITADTTVPSP